MELDSGKGHAVSTRHFESKMCEGPMNSVMFDCLYIFQFGLCAADYMIQI